MPKIGDTVRYLNAVGGGRIVRIEGNLAWVDDDEFVTPVLLHECVVVANPYDNIKELPVPDKSAVKPASTHSVAPKSSQPSTKDNSSARQYHAAPVEDEIKIVEVPGGDTLNIVVAFEPTDRKRLSESDFDASLINDSNYFIYFTLATKDDLAKDWTCRYAGLVEPNTELWLGTFGRGEVALFDRMCLQYVAFKKSREYAIKPAGNVELKVDTTKFCKLHCFRRNKYFDNEVLAFPFVENDIPAGQRFSIPDSLPDDFKKLKGAGSGSSKNTAPKNESRKSTAPNANEPLVVDLHIDSLVDTTAGMSAADMLNLQVDTFRKVMDANLKNFGRKIIFIHGKGEGVLRQALMKELNHLYKGHDVQDASFREYGFGATQVTVRQHAQKFNPKHRK